MIMEPGWPIILLLAFNNSFTICFLKRIPNGIIQYPITFLTTIIPINAVEWDTFINGNCRGWMAHVIQQVTLSNCVVYNVDGSNRNNLIVLGF